MGEPGSRGREPRLVACVDFGSTFTKAALVEVPTGELVATAAHRTTVDTDVLDGWDACRDELVRADPRAADAEVLACSSAGGGLRIGVVGNEELVTAEAGRRVALSSGGRVVHVASGGPGGGLDADGITALHQSAPDVLLLVGGTDGGNAEVLLASARALAAAAWPGPVVVAGNVEARDGVSRILEAAGTPHVLADNVVPQIGVLTPDSARAAIREMFLVHVIGGKHLSRRESSGSGPGSAFTAMVRGATPDVVLTGVELLARGLDEEHPGAGDVVVVDVGGATTDVHSVVGVDPEDAGLAREVVASVPLARTVEGDLGMRWSAVDAVEQGLAAGVLPEGEAASLREAARVRRADPSMLPTTARQHADDRMIATAAVGVALRRHAGRQRVVFDTDPSTGSGRPGRLVERTGKDLREVDLLVGSGGVLRACGDALASEVIGSVTGRDVPGGWQLPEAPAVVVDRDYVLAPAGLLAATHPQAAFRLLRRITCAAWG
ncbi:MAG TPA: glutamate mutase L [Nocardioidaceae bacterium]|nr:glutamate mutase L [Nocardioidaceae bacterium]